MRGESIAVHRVIPLALDPLPRAAGERGVVYGHIPPSGLRIPHGFGRLVGKGQRWTSVLSWFASRSPAAAKPSGSGRPEGRYVVAPVKGLGIPAVERPPPYACLIPSLHVLPEIAVHVEHPVRVGAPREHACGQEAVGGRAYLKTAGERTWPAQAARQAVTETERVDAIAGCSLVSISIGIDVPLRSSAGALPLHLGAQILPGRFTGCLGFLVVPYLPWPYPHPRGCVGIIRAGASRGCVRPRGFIDVDAIGLLDGNHACRAVEGFIARGNATSVQTDEVRRAISVHHALACKTSAGRPVTDFARRAVVFGVADAVHLTSP